MKNIIITTLLTITTAIGALAQDTEKDNREKFQFGFKVGANYSNVYDEKGEDFSADAKLGLAGGVVIAIPVGKYLGIQPEVLFSQKGFKGNGKILLSDYSFTRTSSFIDVPLFLAIKPGEFLTIVVGPQFSYLINQKDEFKSSLVSYNQEQEFKQDNIRKNIFGAVGGIDINLGHVTIGARVAYDLQKNAGDGTATTPRYKNAWFQGTIGYRFFN